MEGEREGRKETKEGREERREENRDREWKEGAIGGGNETGQG
jgi:hypothetical protein